MVSSHGRVASCFHRPDPSCMSGWARPLGPEGFSPAFFSLYKLSSCHPSQFLTLLHWGTILAPLSWLHSAWVSSLEQGEESSIYVTPEPHEDPSQRLWKRQPSPCLYSSLLKTWAGWYNSISNLYPPFCQRIRGNWFNIICSGHLGIFHISQGTLPTFYSHKSNTKEDIGGPENLVWFRPRKYISSHWSSLLLSLLLSGNGRWEGTVETVRWAPKSQCPCLQVVRCPTKTKVGWVRHIKETAKSKWIFNSASIKLNPVSASQMWLNTQSYLSI